MVRTGFIGGIISVAFAGSLLVGGWAGAASVHDAVSKACAELGGCTAAPPLGPGVCVDPKGCSPPERKPPARPVKPPAGPVTVPRNVPSGGPTTPTTGTRVGGQNAITKSSPAAGPGYVPPPIDSQHFAIEEAEKDRAVQSLGRLIREAESDGIRVDLDKPVPFLRDPGPEVPRSTTSIDQIYVPSPWSRVRGPDWRAGPLPGPDQMDIDMAVKAYKGEIEEDSLTNNRQRALLEYQFEYRGSPPQWALADNYYIGNFGPDQGVSLMGITLAAVWGKIFGPKSALFGPRSLAGIVASIHDVRGLDGDYTTGRPPGVFGYIPPRVFDHIPPWYNPIGWRDAVVDAWPKWRSLHNPPPLPDIRPISVSAVRD